MRGEHTAAAPPRLFGGEPVPLQQLRDAKWRAMMQAQSERRSIELALADERDRRQRHEREEKQHTTTLLV